MSKLNVYSVQDAIRGREIRITMSETDGAMARDNLPLDIRSKENPAGLPFNDIEYIKIAEYDTEIHKFINVEHQKVDILTAYKFKVETQVEKMEDGEKGLNERLNNTKIENISENAKTQKEAK